jgi:hypothetical protein
MEDASCGYLMEVPMHLEIYREFQVRDQCLETAACVAFLRKIARLLLLLSLSIARVQSRTSDPNFSPWTGGNLHHLLLPGSISGAKI